MAVDGDVPADSPDLLTREIFGNIPATAQTVFYVVAAAASLCFCWGVYRRMRLWRIGVPPEERSLRGIGGRLWENVLLQRRMITRPRVTTAHRLLFSGFLVLFIGTVLISIEHLLADALGREPTDPLFHKGLYFAVYEVVLDAFGIALLVGCVNLMRRRWRTNASIGRTPADWIVLWAFLVIGVTGYLLEGLRILDAATPLPMLSFVGFSVAIVLELLGVTPERAGAGHYFVWWLHALVSLAFIAAFPYTRLFHSIAGAMTLARPRRPLGTLPLVTMEELEETGRVGVGEIQHFTQPQLIELDACVSCGRCEDACPAFEAGKPLSPRNVVQDLRSHMELAAPRLSSNGDSAMPDLHGDTIAAETLWSCTTCSACVDVCPLGISPLGMITDMRRHLIGEGQLSGAPAASLQKTGRAGNPWGLPGNERFAWAEGLDVATVEENPDFEYLYWVGCAAAYDRRIQNVARSVVKLLDRAGVSFAVLGSEEKCTGEAARRMGDEFLFQELAATNVETLTRRGVRQIVAHCPHCVNSFLHDYPQLGGHYEVLHHSQLLEQLIEQKRLPKAAEPATGKIVYHDPCYLARVNEISQPPRAVVAAAREGNGAGGVTELPRNRRHTACCGGGGGRMWFDDAPANRSGQGRIEEILAEQPDAVAVSCPFCMVMISDGVAASDAATKPVVRDVAEILADAID